jgi:hypothetical protein
MQWVLIIDLENHKSKAGDEKYRFKNFNEYGEEELLAYVVNMSKGDTKVHKILKMDYNGGTTEYTIGFAQGKLGLVKKGGGLD